MWPVAGLPLIRVDRPRYSGAKRFQKRAFDVCFATLVLAASLPLLLVIAVAIKLTSRGPVFYRSERIGLDGQPFSIIKFRSMVADADTQLDTFGHPQRKRRRRTFQDPARSASDERRPHHPPLEYRRVAAIRERAEAADERCRPSAAAAP